jgi:hypothetical protein
LVVVSNPCPAVLRAAWNRIPYFMLSPEEGTEPVSKITWFKKTVMVDSVQNNSLNIVVHHIDFE